MIAFGLQESNGRPRDDDGVHVKIFCDSGRVLELVEDSLVGVVLDGEYLHRALLGGQDMHTASFRDADLRSAIMTNAKLDGANFKGAKLILADLSSSSLTLAVFDETRLDFANLDNADLAEASFIGAEVRHCSFRGANLIGANLLCEGLGEADLAGARFDDRTRFPDRFEPEQSGAIMKSPDGPEST